ncbi:MAG: DNA recombination protein RmuC [Ignavibacteriales bacterium]|nr:DNA recombination protein RmuC [Ignavibacteriales bacterium]
MSILLSIVVIGLVVLIVLFLRRPSVSQDPLQSATFFQQQLDSLRSELASSLKHTTEAVNQHLQIVTTQLSSVTQQLQNNTGQVGQRLDNAAKVIQDVQGKLGELGKATQEIKELGQSVSKLEEMLKAPKLRGGLGELLLEDLLKQVLPVNAYSIQYRFRTGETVDAVIQTAGGKVPVDAKFPLENFRKMVEAKNDQEKKVASRTFVSDVKKHVDAIAGKYIRPDEGTFDFALMYIPAENIYYETIIKDESFAEDSGLYTYATKKHVVPVSPNSFYAHLRVIALGLKGLEIEQSAKEIFQNLQRLGSELGKFADLFETLGLHLTNAKNNYDKADKQLNNFTERLKSLHSPSKDDDDHSQLSLLSGGQ